MPHEEADTPRPPRRWHAYRGAHRARSHEEAHASEAEATLAPVLDHPLVPANEPVLLTTPDALDVLLAELREAGAFAYDSEFIGEQSYYPRLCVIQVATPGKVTLIDARAGLDLRPFWELLADERVEKIVHAGVQDIEPVARHLGRPAQSVVDTQVLAAFAGLRYPEALRGLVETLAGAELSQGSKFSQWDRRPLTAMQLRYAANDVRYLPLLRQALAERLETTGNAAWAAAECDNVFQAAAHRDDPQPARLRVRGLETLRPRQTAVLRALLAWREEAARAEDVPPRALVKDGVLAEMARRPVESYPELARVRGLPRPVEQRHGERIVEATLAALSRPPAPRPAPRDREVDRDRLQAVWEAVQARCRERSIDPTIVASKRELAQHLAADATGPSPEGRLAKGWRAELLGDLLAPEA